MRHELEMKDVRRLLDQSANSLNKDTLSKLAAAREVALSALPAERLASAYHAVGRAVLTTPHPHSRLGYWALSLLLIVSLFSCITYWQQMNDQTAEEVDIAILTDEMPLEVFTD